MLKKLLFWILISCFSGLHAQQTNSLYKTKKIFPIRDTIHIENESINSSFFKLLDANGKPIDSTLFIVNFAKGTLILKENNTFNSDSLTLQYLKFPELLTKEYRIYETSKVVSNEAGLGDLYAIDNKNAKKNIPFDGLNTSGSITRGVTIGNNQNAVLNSNLDLQITGKISEKVSLRASIQDSNIPLQDGGYSQKLDQFDNIFMELFSDEWNIRAGDIFLENNKTQFLNFNKKVQGLATNFNFGTAANKTNVFASAALVRGQYAKSNIIGQEGNQGPYKLKGQNGELYVLVVSGSERVYVNGILLKRGENNDYTIDYNAGEIVFTPLFTITSEMRIAIEYQYSDRNYTRFVTYAGATHENKSWSFGGYLYSENDLKNQPLQQNLSPEQAQILVSAGDDPNLMTAPSAYVDTYSENKVLYRKTISNATEIFEYSNDAQQELFNVRFTLVGSQNGNYVLSNAATITRVYEFIAPINGIPQGNYEPIIQLIAPTKVQVATFLGKYKPTEKTAVAFEIGISNNDKNLFSAIDDANNKGLAAKINAKQRIFSKKWQMDAFANYQFIQNEFRSVERIYNIEFDRDWNLGTTAIGNQSLLVTGLQLDLNPKPKSTDKGLLVYQFEKLDFSENFSGSRHVLNGLFLVKNWTFQNQGSYLKSDASLYVSQFLRNQSQMRFHFDKNWVGSSLRLENNQEKDKTTKQFSALSQKFTEYGLYAGRGDSTKVFVEMGYLRRVNDSLQSQSFGSLIQRVNSSHTLLLKSKLIQTSKSDLSIYANYRVLDFVAATRKKEPTLNSRIVYTDRFFNQLVQSTTVYETNSGSIPQQEFTYLEVSAGQGVYTWNDYNGNGIQELQEFEIAPFIDQAKFIRVFLPNRIYIKTHQNKFSQSLTLNPNQWQNEKGFKKLLSYFYNQTAFIIDRKNRNEGANFELNPFGGSEENVLGLNSSLRNSLFYNRGKQKHSTTYSYFKNKTKNLLSIGSQEATNNSHQLQYNHLYQKSWLFGFFAKTIHTTIQSENFAEKNYDINGYQLAPKISYLFSKSTSWDLFYELQRKENQIGVSETLLQNRFGTAFSYAGTKKFTMNGEVSFYQNKFEGNEFSAVGFQMLEGLQTGQNLTWRLLLQKNITQFLDINFNYQGRKSETSQAIHTGNVQLRAYF
ncbi:hypothetical protein SAMN05444395_11287 [Flavobacterium fryxellicola]|uniref:Uncharacterized protein n=1 Tax=Flavobacterium fryxellicola TaxID=249352 RepID=A0A167XCM9_9FLAO|nr:hypothetical protein [Flavobacterium fryxellicola]OAB28225.1 hypothetical protein FBFR_10335 [Flavobacterium fryxellicola]SHN78234.1 hypothetical protein SAMN05444395_11287 [Flavobacterium fryxellicola]